MAKVSRSKAEFDLAPLERLADELKIQDSTRLLALIADYRALRKRDKIAAIIHADFLDKIAQLEAQLETALKGNNEKS